MIIDAHCHLGQGRYKCLSADALLKSMDDNGIDKAVIVPVEEYIAVNNEEGNAFILSQVKRNPGRFYGFAVASPWYGAAAAENLKRFLDKGLAGVKFNSCIQGFTLNDDIVYPLIEVAKDYRVPVFFHTGTPMQALPLHLRELAQRYPDVDFIMGHMGAWDFGYDVFHAAQGMGNLYLDISKNLAAVVASRLKDTGADRMIFSSDMPRSDQRFELDKLKEVCTDEADFERICCKNIMKLLEKKK